MERWTDARLELLHDHYKDSFSYIREGEKRRDSLFLFVIALLGILFLEVQYPNNFQTLFSEIEAQGAKFTLKSIPMAVIMSVTWTIVLTLAMRYCQTSINIERQYDYLHEIERKLMTIVGDKDIFIREGRSYLNNYPLFSTWALIYYTAVFPAIFITSITILIYIEWSIFQSSFYYQLYDTIIAVAIAITFFLYRIAPQIRLWWETRRNRGRNNRSIHTGTKRP